MQLQAQKSFARESAALGGYLIRATAA